MFKEVFNYLSQPIPNSIINLICIIILVLGNNQWQVLCRPTLWATVSLIISFSSTIIYPLIKSKPVNYLLALLNGISTVTYLYFIIFLGHMNVWGFIYIIVLGVGILTFIPHFLLIQLIKNYLWKQSDRILKICFTSGITLSLIFVISSVIVYEIKASKLKLQLTSTIEPTFVNEKILGMHFIYHTEFCGWDGWRPPLHEPTLIFWLWLGGGDFITNDLDERIKLYQSVFPQNKIKKSCTCASEYKEWYLNDSLWIRNSPPFEN